MQLEVFGSGEKEELRNEDERNNEVFGYVEWIGE